MYSPGSLNRAIVAAFPMNCSFTPPPRSFSISGLALSKVTLPGPRYFDHVSDTGGGGFSIGAFVPLEYLASSSVQIVSDSADETDVVRVRKGLVIVATGP